MKSLGHILVMIVLFCGMILAKSGPEIGRAISRSLDSIPVGRTAPDPLANSAAAGDVGRTAIDEMMTPEFMRPQRSNSVAAITSRLSYNLDVERTNRIVALMPTNSDQYQNMFDVEPSISQLNEIRAGVDDLLSIAGGRSDEDIRVSSRGEFANIIRDSHEEFITIIAHNDNGMLRLPDGSSISVADATYLCEAAMKRCVFVACESSSYAYEGSTALYLRSNIRFRDAALLSRFLHQIIVDGSSTRISLSEATAQLQDTLSRGELAVAMGNAVDSYVVPGALLGSGYAVYASVGDILEGEAVTDEG